MSWLAPKTFFLCLRINELVDNQEIPVRWKDRKSTGICHSQCEQEATALHTWLTTLEGHRYLCVGCAHVYACSHVHGHKYLCGPLYTVYWGRVSNRTQRLYILLVYGAHLPWVPGELTPPLRACHHTHWALTWALGHWTPVLILQQQALYPLSHLFSPDITFKKGRQEETKHESIWKCVNKSINK